MTFLSRFLSCHFQETEKRVALQEESRHTPQGINIHRGVDMGDNMVTTLKYFSLTYLPWSYKRIEFLFLESIRF